MKKFVLFLFIVFGSANLFAQTAQKTAYVNSEIIYEQYAPAIKAQSDLEALATKWRATRDSMVQALQAQFTEYQKQAQTMPQEKQREAQQKLAAGEQKITEFEQAKFGQQNGEFFIKQTELFKPIRERVLKAIEDVAKAESYTFVFDKTETVSTMVYGDAEFDITYKVLDLLKKDK